MNSLSLRDRSVMGFDHHCASLQSGCIYAPAVTGMMVFHQNTLGSQPAPLARPELPAMINSHQISAVVPHLCRRH